MKGPPETIAKDFPPDVNAVECIFEPRIAENPVNSPVVFLEPCDLGEEPREEIAVERAEVSHEPVDANDLLEEYGWMADSDQFDQQAMEEIQQEDFIEQCFEDMWEEEDRMRAMVSATGDATPQGVESNLDKLAINDVEALVPQAHLNPDAVDFIPRSVSDS